MRSNREKSNTAIVILKKLCERFSARYQQKGGGWFPLLLFDDTKNFLKIKHDLMRPVLCYGKILRFF